MADGFQFNFFEASECKQAPLTEPSSEQIAYEVLASDGLKELQGASKVQITPDIELVKGTISSEEAATLLGVTELKESDLVPSVYEGGFKLWEGAVDLSQFLCQQHQLDAAALKDPRSTNPLQGKKVLELGCGHGLPGIISLLAGAHVHFQDYNEQVLTQLTIPNVLANLSLWQTAGGERAVARYYAGDWLALGNYLAKGGRGGYYDIVLTAETIYSEESQIRLLECIKQVLEPPHGVAYVAAKSYYFGVGGGTHAFQQRVKEDGILDCQQVWKIEDGASNKREILKLSFPASITPYFL